jgi:hypothetical protein
MAKPKLGSGVRFAKLAAQVSPAFAAWRGRKKLGKQRFQQLASAGLRRAAKKSGS